MSHNEGASRKEYFSFLMFTFCEKIRSSFRTLA